MTDYITAAQLLQSLIESGALSSQYKRYINARIRCGVSFYTDILAKEGKEAAERALVEWNRELRMSDYAAVIEPVARGMLALASTDSAGKYSYVIDVSRDIRFPQFSQIGEPSKMIVLFNRQAPGCGCHQPEGSDNWALSGQLGLKAVTLQAGMTYDGRFTTAQLGLVLPRTRASFGDVTSDEGFVVATIDLTGHINGHSYSPPGFRRNGYLMQSLGLITTEQAVISGSNSSGGHFDHAIGFPGATNYLADALPSLGKYFTELAAKLVDHDHH